MLSGKLEEILEKQIIEEVVEEDEPAAQHASFLRHRRTRSNLNLKVHTILLRPSPQGVSKLPEGKLVEIRTSRREPIECTIDVFRLVHSVSMQSYFSHQSEAIS